jgi:hypothetical protein
MMTQSGYLSDSTDWPTFRSRYIADAGMLVGFETPESPNQCQREFYKFTTSAG